MKTKHFLLVLILFVYAGLYIATSTPDKCDNDCERTNQTFMNLRLNRPYVSTLYRCTNRQGSDTLCVFVSDTTGIDWNLFADTACMVASQNGLPRQKIFIIKSGATPPDTLAKKVCP
ncbi:MAG: hypothetical protein NTW29_02640 [Bacteroidetes bacterium]|nr:hypothetical protein [Bacteroidota bacterium]